jgi:hypothetical protein
MPTRRFYSDYRPATSVKQPENGSDTLCVVYFC